MLPVTPSLYVEEVGTAPTPKDFQSSAMTSSATPPKNKFKENNKNIKNNIIGIEPILHVLTNICPTIRLNTAK